MEQLPLSEDTHLGDRPWCFPALILGGELGQRTEGKQTKDVFLKLVPRM